jgi:hypothetical protein
MTAATYNLLDEAVRAARYLLPDADDDAVTALAEQLIIQFPARVSVGVVQERLDWASRWRTVPDVDPEQVPSLNRAYGWTRYRVVEIGVCP